MRPTLIARSVWRGLALVSLIPLAMWLNLLVGPGAQGPFAGLQGVDFGAFYSGATLVWDGRVREVGDVEAQRETQRAFQERENTGWRWYNSLPHPPVVSLMTAPLAALSLRTAYWVFVIVGLATAGLAILGLVGSLCRQASVAAAVVLLSFEPIWNVAWWGQIDNVLLLPVAIGVGLLVTGRSSRRDLIAGLFLGALALKPIFVPVPLLALAWGRRPAALGMTATGGLLAAISVAAVGIQGVRDYISLSRSYQQFAGTPFVVEWRMFNLRGQLIRLQTGLGERAELLLVLAISFGLAALAIIVAGRALRANQAPDVAMGIIILAMLLTAYHVHVQSLVFLTVPLAVCIGRSLRGWTLREVALWGTPAVAILAGVALLRPEHPSPSPDEAGLESYLTLCCLALLVALMIVGRFSTAHDVTDGGFPRRQPRRAPIA